MSDADDLAGMLRASESDRARWLVQRQPSSENRANWWLHLLLVIDSCVRDQPAARAAWVELRLWMTRQGPDMGDSTIDVTIKIAHFVADLRGTSGLHEVLPSTDDLVRECLAAIPTTIDHVHTNEVLDEAHIAEMRLSRQAKNLINVAEPHLENTTDVDLAAELRQWIAIKPRLV